MRGFENLKSKEFDLEAFMVSITYPPAGMTMNLARKLVTAERWRCCLSASTIQT